MVSLRVLIVCLLVSGVLGCAQWQPEAKRQEHWSTPLGFTQISSLSVVNNLYQQSREQWLSGASDDAATSLERALRMEPDNGYLWLGLAQLAKAKRDTAKAKEFGSRAYSFASSDDRLNSAVKSFLKEL